MQKLSHLNFLFATVTDAQTNNKTHNRVICRAEFPQLKSRVCVSKETGKKTVDCILIFSCGSIGMYFLFKVLGKISTQYN